MRKGFFLGVLGMMIVVGSLMGSDCLAETATVYNLPDENSGPTELAAPSGQGIWCVEKDAKRIALLRPGEGLGRQAILPKGGEKNLGIGFHVVAPPKTAAPKPAVVNVGPKTTLVNGTDQEGFLEIEHGISRVVDLAFTRDRIWFVSEEEAKVFALDPRKTSGFSGGANRYAFESWSVPGGAIPTAIATDTSGIVWVVSGDSKRLLRLDPAKNRITWWLIPNSSKPGDGGIVCALEGFLWIGDRLGNTIHRFDAKRGSFSAFALPFDNGPAGLAMDADGSLWMSVRNVVELGTGLNYPAVAVLGSNLTYYELPLSFEGPEVVKGDSLGRIWCVSYSSHRIGVLDPWSRKFVWHVLPFIPSGSTEGLAIDPDGNVWFSNKGTNYVGKIPNAAHHTLYFPFFMEAGSLGSRLSLTNTHNEVARVEIFAYGANSGLLGKTETEVPPGGKQSDSLKALFPGKTVGWLKAISGMSLRGMILFENGGKPLAGKTAALEGAPDLSFGHLQMPNGSPAFVILCNPGLMENPLTLQAHDATGKLLGTKPPTLGPGEMFLTAGTDIATPPPGTEAWIEVASSPGSSLCGFQLFVDGNRIGALEAMAR